MSSKYLRMLVFVIGTAVLLMIWGWFASSNEVRQLANARDCKRNMDDAISALLDYIHDHSDVPRDEHDQFNPNEIVCKSSVTDKCIHADFARCNLQFESGSTWQGLVWFQNLTPSQIDSIQHSRSPPFILLCHDANCLHKIGNNALALISFSNGLSLYVDVDKMQYRHWLDNEFRNGNVAIPDFMNDQVISSLNH